MKHNVNKVLALLEEGLIRECEEMNRILESKAYTKVGEAKAEGRVNGIRMAISWVENNIS